MDFDFELLLFTLTAGSGIIWMLDAILLGPGRKRKLAEIKAVEPDLPVEEEEKILKLTGIADFAKSLFPIFFIVLLFRSFFFEPFRIPSGSLEPTLLIGDFILVNKYDYGVRLPVLHTKIIEVSEPERGDIAVFRWPENPKVDFIKRIVGVPGDKISYINKELFINGEAASQQFLSYKGDHDEGHGASRVVIEKTEDLAGVKHKLYMRPDAPTDNFVDVVVPEGHYFAMGDNRDDSNDSRYWGFVPEENLVGKAVLIWMSWDSENHTVRFHRIGKLIN